MLLLEFDAIYSRGTPDETDVTIQDDLVNRGMVEIDNETGEDVRKVQRQQYENWFKQRKTWSNEKALR